MWRAYSRHHLALNPRIGIERLEAREDPGHGYYAPAQYTEWGPGVLAQWTPRPDVTLTGDMMVGWQSEAPAGWDSFVNASGASLVFRELDRRARGRRATRISPRPRLRAPLLGASLWGF